MELNIVFAGNPPFPNGGAMTKRWRYMIDYMNENKISSHIMCTSIEKKSVKNNPKTGLYGYADYVNLINNFDKYNFIKFAKLSKSYIKKWYREDKKNIIIFNTILDIWEIPICIYALQLGYKVVFDIVETSYRLNGNISLKYKLRMLLNESITKIFYRKSSSIVISTLLMNNMKRSYPKMKLCLLTNSTPILNNKYKNGLNNPLTLLYAGTYSEKDGVRYLIEGVISAYESGLNCKLDLYGKGSDKDMEVLKLTLNKKYIAYHGFVSDEELHKRMNNADILCMTRCNSIFANYGFPFKLSEYLATGNIVIATCVGDVNKYIIDKKDAYLVEPGNSKAISDIIIYIYNHVDEALEVANNGKVVVEKYFDINKNGEILIDFLSKI